MLRLNRYSYFFSTGAEVSYVDFKLGDTEGWVRFTKEGSAKEILEKLTDGKLKICDSDVIFTAIEGEEEKSYLEKSIGEMVKRRKNQKNYSRQNKGKNRGGRQGGRKRRQDNSDDAPPSKIKAAES